MNALDLYLIGCLIALIGELIKIACGLDEKLSLRAKNFKNFGLIYIVSQGYVEEEEVPSIIWVALRFTITLLLVVAMSWLAVLGIVVDIIRKLENLFGIPEQVKEFNYKVKNYHFTKKELFLLDEDLKKSLGIGFANRLKNMYD